MEDDVDVSLGSDKTGRNMLVYSSKNPTSLPWLRDLLIECVEDEVSDRLISYLEPIIKAFEVQVTEPELTCFRGADRSVQEFLREKGEFKLGPNPEQNPQRYNRSGQSALYLISDRDCIPLEIETTDEWIVQEYRIPSARLRIADLSIKNKNIDGSLNEAMFIAEAGNILGGYDIEVQLEARSKDPYQFSQLLADLFRSQDWDGLLVPGVRGKGETRYNNIVMFDPGRWKDWAIGTITKVKQE